MEVIKYGWCLWIWWPTVFCTKPKKEEQNISDLAALGFRLVRTCLNPTYSFTQKCEQYVSITNV